MQDATKRALFVAMCKRKNPFNLQKKRLQAARHRMFVYAGCNVV
jgi:hypothetical protein